MPTILSHPAIPLAAAMVGGRNRISSPLLLASVVASSLPDADVIGLYLGIPYEHMMGHRGFSHSIAFALLIGVLGLLIAPRLRSGRLMAFTMLFISTVSHGLLDALTNGGLGIAFLSPFSNQRFFFPWSPIAVSPLSLAEFLSPLGWEVLRSEATWVWLPSLIIGALGLLCRRVFRRAGQAKPSPI